MDSASSKTWRGVPPSRSSRRKPKSKPATSRHCFSPFSVRSTVTDSSKNARVCSSTPGSIELASPSARSRASSPPCARLRNMRPHTSSGLVSAHSSMLGTGRHHATLSARCSATGTIV
eukprot:6262642-Prymnesium_polylepis.2